MLFSRRLNAHLVIEIQKVTIEDLTSRLSSPCDDLDFDYSSLKNSRYLDPVTLVLKLDLGMVKISPYIKTKFLCQAIQKLNPE